ncbi:MAG: replicative DNA helicase [Acidimicrobiia bacterium]|nr:replicative DNA helicase [Acidimicrobiia bacterium]
MVQSIEDVRRRQQASGGRVPPHNLEAEESLLGAMLLSRDAITSAVEARVDDADFYKPAHAHVFEAIMSLYGQGEPSDPVTVAEELRRSGLLDHVGGKAALLRIQAATPASANAGHYAQIVRELSLLRRLIAVAGEIAELGYSDPDDVTETLDRAETLVFEVAEHRVAETMVGLHSSLQSTLDQLEQMYGRDGHITGHPTGFLDLDDLLLGLQPSNLVVVAARPGQGKTSFALGAAAHVALETRKPVVFFSMEMGSLELTKRLLAGEARVDARKLSTGNIPDADWTRLSHAVGRLAEAPFFIDDNAHCTVMEMRAKARRVKARHGDLGLVVVDYLQLMSSSRRAENRQVEVSELSRGLKILARELDCPVMALSQLNRSLEYRQDKRPMLADLRESGCLTADTRVARADTGEEVTLGELFERGERDVPVWTLDEHYRLIAGTMTHVFSSGRKPTFELRLASGRRLRGSGNHPFLTVDGWRRLDQLAPGSRIATARRLPEPAMPEGWSDAKAVLLAHMLGDGCHVPRHSLQYTTTDPANAEVVARAAREAFGVEARIVRERTWIQTYLASPERLARGRRNPIAAWLDGLGLWGRRSWQKHVPPAVLGLPHRQVVLFLHHLWATDGSITVTRKGAVRVYYASTSRPMVEGVQALLLRLGIPSRVRRTRGSPGRPGYTVDVSGRDDQLRFFDVVGAHGARGETVPRARELLEGREANPNVDTIPAEVWDHVRRKLLPELGVTSRELASRLGMSYCGSTLYRHGLSRARMARLADALPDPWLRDLATSDVLWDRVVEVVPTGVEPVFDATVLDTHNFLANGVVAHNSIEQDADVVCFIYRDEAYHPDSDQRGTAEIIVAKHRNGPTGSVRLAFLDHLTKFANMARD